MTCVLACANDTHDDVPLDVLSGGDATVYTHDRLAFSHPAPNLTDAHDRAFFRGKALFRDMWVTAPSSTFSHDGLGPTFNTRSCEGCHQDDGRGSPPNPGDSMRTMVMRISIPGEDDNGGPKDEPNYGEQIQSHGILGIDGESDPTVTYEERQGHYADGTSYSLRVPTYHLGEPSYGPFHDDILISPRVAPAMIGLGLLEAISEETLMALADPDDHNRDGISGRMNMVWDVVKNAVAIGRFGWKANQPTLLQQAAGAFLGDIGMTSRLFNVQNCPSVQTDCVHAPDGGVPEISDNILDDVVLYSRTLGVPAARNVNDPDVLRGRAIFQEAGCNRCHIETLTTGDYTPVPEFSNQTIHPYTDLLLHDMGAALADGRPDFLATGFEWRTRSLWGIGLVPHVNGHGNYLHDGRARGIAEAILWHGGEAASAKSRFVGMSAADRAALLRFIESL